jgi:hypothetical protein
MWGDTLLSTCLVLSIAGGMSLYANQEAAPPVPQSLQGMLNRSYLGNTGHGSELNSESPLL